MIPDSVELFMKALIIVTCILALLSLRRFFKKPGFNNNFQKHQENYLLEAKAIVLDVELTGLYLNHQAQVKLQMQVLPDRGRNFVTEIKELFAVAELAKLQTGNTMKVKYNPANTKEIALVKIT